MFCLIKSIRSGNQFARLLSTVANPKVFFDITIGGQDVGRIDFEVSV